MKTLLIVEDEKMIRQGIKAIVQRSGVPIEVIIECNNGETALQVIREQKVDVMFTDIRMPKMDGIELVRRMQNCEHIPITVAISGYDDFSYAVEMLRNGVREYILKPIEREKIIDILHKLNKEIERNEEQDETERRVGCQQMKHIMLATQISEEELVDTEKLYAERFFVERYYVCCINHKNWSFLQREDIILLEDMDDSDIYIIPEKVLDACLEGEVQGGYLGISDVHEGVRELKQAYTEACEMRKRAFFRSVSRVCFQEKKERIPEQLIQEAEKLLTEDATMQRVQLIGTDRTEDLIKSIKQLFFVAKNERITAGQFEMCIHAFLREISNIYKEEMPEICKRVWLSDCIDAYEEELMGFVLSLHHKINTQFDISRNEQKMRDAVTYIEEHYFEDLNMAVVSNYVSMNYSLFSYSFKQHTGTNFVNFLKGIRMREAKRLLAESEEKIIEISQKVGYDNEKHFMKIFKSTYGVSPSEYRKNVTAQLRHKG